MTQLNIIGTGHTNFGSLDLSAESLIKKATEEALNDADITFSDCDAVVVSNFSSQFTKQSHTSAVVASIFNDSEIVRVEGACASGALAFKEAAILLLSGIYKTVLVIGFEKMTSVSTEEATQILMSAASPDEAAHGFTFPSLFALMARAHFEKYGSKEKDLALIAVKNHFNANNNPLAHFHKKINVDDVLKSRVIASPIKLLDSSPISDGAAAIILTSNHEPKKTKAKLVSVGHTTDKIGLWERQNLYQIPAVQSASLKAYKSGDIRPSQIDFAEVHDCFTIAELIQIEELGFSEKGKSIKLIRDGETYTHGKLPINPSGGLKAKGHPIGATGISQIVEIVKQFQGKCALRQVKKVNYGLACNIGGSGSTAVVSILKNTK